MTKEKTFRDLSYGAGRYDGSKITASFIDGLRKKYGFKEGYNLKNKIDDALLNYYAGEPVKEAPTEKQRNKRLEEISSYAEQLEQMLHKLHDKEVWHVQKAITNRLKEVDGKYFDPKGISKPASFYNEVQTLKTSLLRISSHSKLGIVENPKSDRRRPSKSNEKESIYRLLNAFIEGTESKMTLTYSENKEGMQNSIIEFCMDIFDEQYLHKDPERKLSYIFTKQLVFETAKEFRKRYGGKVAQK